MKPINGLLGIGLLTLGLTTLTASVTPWLASAQIYIPVPAPRDYYMAFQLSVVPSKVTVLAVCAAKNPPLLSVVKKAGLTVKPRRQFALMAASRANGSISRG